MPRRSTPADAPPPGFTRSVVLPVFAAMTATAAVLGGGLYLAAEASNALSVERQARMVRQALDTSVDQLAQTQEIVAVWDDSYHAMRAGVPDPQWMDDNVGVWLHEAYGHDRVYLLDAEARPLYAMVGGERHPPAAYDAVSAIAAPLIAELRGQATKGHRHDVVSVGRATLLPSGIRMPAGALHVSHLDEIDGRAAAISVMAVVPNSRGRTAPPDQRGYLVSIRFLGSAFFDELARRNLLNGVHFRRTKKVPPGFRSIPVHGDDGDAIGHIVWQPELPGRYIMARVAPIAVGAVVLIVIILTLLIASLRRSSGRLQATLAELRESEAQALHLASHDPLTGLSNRAHFNAALDACLRQRTDAAPAALMLLDLDRFKRVNDTLGHGAGDLLLVEVAARLRAICSEGAVVARLGGDEFAILFPTTPDLEALEALCEELLGELRRAFPLEGAVAHVGASIGVALADAPALDRVELVRRADIALFRAKAEGRNAHRMFQPAMDAQVRQRAILEDALRHALIMGEGLSVHYQPLVAVRSGAVKGLEALVRWQHPALGTLAPDDFLPVAEEVGLIGPLGEWVFREVCAATRRWPDLYLAINLSPLQFCDETLATRLLTIAREEQVDPCRIELEITEHVLMAEYPSVGDTLSALRAAGFRVALDDFGTGYSSLGYLRRFKVDKIKIDRSFVRNVGRDTDSAAIVAAIISLGHSMGLRITAEGVDMIEQMRFLALAGCDELQGFLYAPAMPESDLATFFAAPVRTARSAA